jgi:hypothetical protein
MKNIKEVYQALLDGKTLVCIAGDRITLDNSHLYSFSEPEKWKIYDKFTELKRAHSEGAIIECSTQGGINWFAIDPYEGFSDSYEYRIKGNINIKQWDKWKDLIKAWWDGTEIEIFDTFSNKWIDIYEPSWATHCEYRIKPSQWEMKPAEWYISTYGEVVEHSELLKQYTKKNKAQLFGMVYHTKEQAEKAKNQMKKANLLRYWVSTMQDLDEGRAYIFKCRNGKYDWFYSTLGRVSFGEIYMTEDTAEKICNALNKGELEL